MVALLALLPMATGMALAEPDHGYDRIFIFGASFMDSGNHFAVTGESAHPPFDPTAFTSYNIGGHRPSNGHTWVEILAREMNLAKWAKPAYRDPAFGNYAYAYGRAREVPYDPAKSLTTQVNDWIANGYCTNVPMTDTLFIVDGAYADMFDVKAAFDDGDMEAVVTIMEEVADAIEANIRTLYGCGARNLMFVYIPPAEYSPIANQGFPPELVDTPLSEAYNYQLYLELFDPLDDDPLPADMNISTVDFFSIFKNVMAMRESLGFTNVIDTCITYYVTKGAICKNRDEYFWWDMVHPTKKVHALLGQIALFYLPDLD